MREETRALAIELIDQADRTARFILEQTPDSLRAWAARKEDMRASGRIGTCLPADALTRCAEALEAALCT